MTLKIKYFGMAAEASARSQEELENQVKGGHSSKASYSFTVDASKPIYSYKYALVLEEPATGHTKFEKPYFKVNLYDNTSNEAITCADFMVYADPSDDIFTKEFLRIDV